MTPAEIRHIRQASAKAILEMIKVYDTEVPENLQCNETFDFFYVCLLGEVANAFDKWGYEKLRKLKESDFTTDEEEEEGD